MTTDRVFNLLGAIVTVGLVTVLVTNAAGTARLVNSLGSAFQGSLRTAMGGK